MTADRLINKKSSFLSGRSDYILKATNIPTIYDRCFVPYDHYQPLLQHCFNGARTAFIAFLSLPAAIWLYFIEIWSSLAAFTRGQLKLYRYTLKLDRFTLLFNHCSLLLYQCNLPLSHFSSPSDHFKPGMTVESTCNDAIPP